LSICIDLQSQARSPKSLRHLFYQRQQLRLCVVIIRELALLWEVHKALSLLQILCKSKLLHYIPHAVTAVSHSNVKPAQHSKESRRYLSRPKAIASASSSWLHSYAIYFATLLLHPLR